MDTSYDQNMTHGVPPGWPLQIVDSPVARLLCPGLPDRLEGNGRSLGWTEPDGVSILHEGTVYWHPLAHPTIQAAGCSWMVRGNGTDGPRLLRFEDGRYQDVPVPDGTVRIHAGLNCNAFVTARGTFATNQDGVTIPLSIGARCAQARPWATGMGWTWVDQDTVYRTSGSVTRAVGRLPRAPDHWVSGPQGAAVFWCGESCIVLAARGVLQPTAALYEETCVRFEPNGTHLLALGDEQILVDLVSGRSASAGVALVPVALHEGTWSLDEDTGIVVDQDGQSIAQGFVPGACAVGPRTLFGPGEGAWDLDTGDLLWTHPGLTATWLVALEDGVACIDSEVMILAGSGQVLWEWELPLDLDPDEIVGASGRGTGLVLWTPTRTVALDSKGTVLDDRTYDTPQVDLRAVETEDGEVLLLGTSEVRTVGSTVETPETTQADGILVDVVMGPAGIVFATTEGLFSSEWQRADLLACAIGRNGALIWVLENERLVQVDPKTGRTVHEVALVPGCEPFPRWEGARLEPSNELWAWSGDPDWPNLTRFDSETGRTLHSWPLACDGITVGEQHVWCWTDT
ncbi:MAG: hypothetical protein QGG40_10510, partial [Myxococcota bacterium]|nr:hypothetical protein [Myxococcota bacterium]